MLNSQLKVIIIRALNNKNKKLFIKTIFMALKYPDKGRLSGDRALFTKPGFLSSHDTSNMNIITRPCSLNSIPTTHREFIPPIVPTSLVEAF